MLLREEKQKRTFGFGLNQNNTNTQHQTIAPKRKIAEIKIMFRIWDICEEVADLGTFNLHPFVEPFPGFICQINFAFSRFFFCEKRKFSKKMFSYEGSYFKPRFMEEVLVFRSASSNYWS